jgi:hypothetical protein
MAATLVSSIITQVRAQLVEATARFWSDAELVSIMNLGAQDLWRAILDLHQDHFFRINSTDVYLRANDDEITGIPGDCFRVQLIEPRDTTVTTAGHQVLFIPKKYTSTDFIVARTQDAVDPGSLPARQIYYQIVGEGAPAAPPRILTAPLLNADLALRLVYNPTISISATTDYNPIPGAADNALKAWTIAYARAKETDGRIPDAGWLSIYATEKELILLGLTPREEQDVEIVEDMFQGFGHGW